MAIMARTKTDCDMRTLLQKLPWQCIHRQGK
jgi:hypothetical protein